jgi:hypothetical protein
MGPSQIVIDIGPNLLTFLLALVSASAGLVAAVYSVRGKRAVDQANGNLALAIQRRSAENAAADHTATSL